MTAALLEQTSKNRSMYHFTATPYLFGVQPQLMTIKLLALVFLEEPAYGM
jgi:hypothetical protein